MLRSDTYRDNVNSVFSNIHTINMDVILEIQKELELCDLISLVFLLYDVPDTALQRLIVLQRVSKDIEGNNLNLLCDWALNSQSRPNWKYEFLEALAICQLYNIVRKLGFHVPTVKRHYLPDNMHVNLYVDPMKKALYKLCENIDSDNLIKLKKTLITYDIDTTEYAYCELIFLDLMSRKFINCNKITNERKVSASEYEVENLTKILQNISSLKKFAVELKEIENRLNFNPKLSPPHKSSTPLSKTVPEIESKKQNKNDEYQDSFDEIYQLINELKTEDITIKHLKSDKSELDKNAYVIKNTKRVGVCYIINQEEFHPSKDSIEGKVQSTPLDDRLGSTRDKLILEKTMSLLNFEVISHDNLECKKMFQCIKEIIQYRVQHDDSIFMLCILSHGVRGHIYAADSVKVKVEDIQNLLDSDDALNLRGIPKVLILQACQVDEVEPQLKLVADGPTSNYYLRKSDFLIYWATAPEYEAYRDVTKGSIFIQILCSIIHKFAKHEHLYDIFTKVTDSVTRICTRLERAQVPIFESTLRKKIYLQIPEKNES